MLPSLYARSTLLGLVLSLPACSETPTSSTRDPITEEDEDNEDDDDTGKTRDASVRPRIDAGTTAPKPDATVKPDASGTRDASVTPPKDATVSPTQDASRPPPDPFAPGDRTPDPSNIAECPDVAPDNPIGSCIGVPVYAVCKYNTYTCICDWYHWLCL